MVEEAHQLGRHGEELDEVLTSPDLVAVGLATDRACGERREQHQRRIPHAPIIVGERLDADDEALADITLHLVPQLTLVEQLLQDVQRVHLQFQHLAPGVVQHHLHHLPDVVGLVWAGECFEEARHNVR